MKAIFFFLFPRDHARRVRLCICAYVPVCVCMCTCVKDRERVCWPSTDFNQIPFNLSDL